MSFGGKSLTKADLERRRKIHSSNCVACSQWDIDVTDSGYVQWHHLNGRKHHDQTVALCQWHHVGRPHYHWTAKEMRDSHGPSLFHESKAFHAEFGSNEELLQRQNDWLGEGNECVD